MTSVEVKDIQGAVVRRHELPAELFEAAINVPVMHQVVVAGMAAQRAGTHSTKTRGEVSGGGRKPWRQKGTGRARQGSIRAPQWSGGGIAHGPKPRSYEQRVNKKMRKLALRSALTDALQSGKLAVVEGLAFDGPRTKDALEVLRALALGGRILLVIPAPDEAVEKSFRNLDFVKIDYPGNLNTYDLLYADSVLLTAEALQVLAGGPGAEGAEPRREAEQLHPVSEAGPAAEAPTGDQATPPAEAPTGDQADAAVEGRGPQEESSSEESSSEESSSEESET